MRARALFMWYNSLQSPTSMARYRSLFAGAHLPAIAVYCLTAGAVGSGRDDNIHK